jgi:GNAT superfamily N-acetyltransferase
VPSDPHPDPGVRVDVVCLGDVASSLAAPDLGSLRDARPAPGFVAGSWLVLATVDDRIIGSARLEPTAIPFPADRSGVLGALGGDRADDWLAGAAELVELNVHPSARRSGVGSLLAATACSLAGRGRAWVTLAGADVAALPFFLARLWRLLPESATDSSVVLLADTHPAVHGRRDGADEPTAPARKTWTISG